VSRCPRSPTEKTPWRGSSSLALAVPEGNGHFNRTCSANGHQNGPQLSRSSKEIPAPGSAQSMHKALSALLPFSFAFRLAYWFVNQKLLQLL
jgi:hypothetical protein